jgi:hypothetical protein
VPAKDFYHETVKRALIKDGWAIDDEQVRLKIGSRNLWIDLQASQADGSLAVLIEVKGFENSPSSVDELSDAVGQYMMYSVVLAARQIPTPLYLAVPVAAYQKIWSESLGQEIIQRLGIKLLVFDPTEKVIARWRPIPQP